MKDERISAQDKALFRQEVKDVTPLATSEKPVAHKQRSNPNPLYPKTPKSQEIKLTKTFTHKNIIAGNSYCHAKAGVQKRLLRKLRNGQLAIDSQLDLHGMNINQAEKKLLEYFNYCLQQGFRCIKVIHGKGKTVDVAPPLQNLLYQWLCQQPEVVAFSTAPKNEGGTGATIILLKLS